MKLTKSGLKEMIRECLQEELAKDSLTEGGAMSGGYAQGGALDTYARPGASTQPGKKSYLNRLKSNNPELVDIMTVKGKDIKPGMITQAGQVKQAEVRERGMYIMHTNNYDGFWGVDEDMEVMVDPDDKSKPFTGDYKDLLKRGLKEAVNTDDSINEAATGFRLTGAALLSVEDLADAVYRDNDPDAIKKYASSKDIKDVTVEDLAIAAENSDLSREVKYLAAHMKNKGVATIGEFAAKLNDTKVVEALDEVEGFDLDNIFEALDKLYEEVEDPASDETVDTNLDEGIFGNKEDTYKAAFKDAFKELGYTMPMQLAAPIVAASLDALNVLADNEYDTDGEVAKAKTWKVTFEPFFKKPDMAGLTKVIEAARRADIDAKEQLVQIQLAIAKVKNTKGCGDKAEQWVFDKLTPSLKQQADNSFSNITA